MKDSTKRGGGQSEYTILLAADPSSLSSLVNNLIVLGWEPQGGVALAELHDDPEQGSAQWAQAMTRRAPASAGGDGEEAARDTGGEETGPLAEVEGAIREVRQARAVIDDEGTSQLSWYERTEAATALTDALERLRRVEGALRAASPRPARLRVA